MKNPIEKFFNNQQPTSLREFSKWQSSFDRLFNDMMTLKNSNSLQSFEFSPSCDVSEEANSYVLKFDLPGVPKDKVKVEIDGNQITVSAERKEEKTTEDKKKYLSEIAYGSYARTFTLPGPVDEKKVDAKFDNGVLTVSIPKTEVEKTKQIPVQ